MKKIHIQLINQRWEQSNQGQNNFRGTIFSNGAMLRTLAEVEKLFSQPGKDSQFWYEAISSLNGFFALVWQAEGRVVAAVDCIRSIPLFYGEKSDEVFISDDAEWLRQQVGEEIMDPVARAEFELTGYVTGQDTLYKNVKQLQAGELLIIDQTAAAPQLQTRRYYRFHHTEPRTYVESKLRQDLDKITNDCVRRLIDYANGRQIVIPLSGGYDSRLIATLLCKQGYKNIATFTYGIKGNKESAYSYEVAQALGLKWHFVEYSAEKWQRTWNTDERKKYQEWASGWTSLPHLQDFGAVQFLKNNGLIDMDCVFVPGHSGDFVAGDHIPDEAFESAPVTLNTLVEKVLHRHYAHSANESEAHVKFTNWKAKVIDRAEVKDITTHVELADAFEKWDWQERQAKYIVNSVRVYEFFGYDWWLPFWDKECMQFWETVPLLLRKKRRWYLSYVKQVYAEETGLNVENNLNNAADIGFFGRSIRSFLEIFPPNVKDQLKVVHHKVFPKRITNAYIVSHLSASEFKRLQKRGHYMIGMLIQEFLESIPAAPRHQLARRPGQESVTH